MRISALCVAVAALAVSACSTNAERCSAASNPTECRAWGDAGGDVEDYLIGGMAGYMLGSAMSGGRSQPVIIRDPMYAGPARRLRSPILSRDRQIERLERKVAAQKVELRRQQDANRRYKAERRSSGWKSYRSFGRRR